MKILLWVQRILALLAGIYGFLALFSQVPITESVWSQFCLNAGGLVLILLAWGWIWLTGVEEQWIETK